MMGMESFKKLDTFILRDKYCLSFDAILVEAHACAARRADMMNWQEIDLRDSGNASMREGDFNCYTFEIWGIETSGASGGSDQKSDPAAAKKSDGFTASDIVL